jgi:hypothetical protein
LETKMSDQGNDKPASEPEARVIDLDKLRFQRICMKRYGRARLTILRWGGLGLFGDQRLGQALTVFRAGEASAEDVAWAFVRSRVDSHSPSFRFEDAELERLIDVVTDCSKSPHFEAKTAEELAEELVKAQDEEREQMKRLTEQFTRSFTNINKLSTALQPQIASWATEQQRTMAALSKSFAAPRLGALGAMSTPTAYEQMSKVGLTANIRKELFPTLPTMKALQLATTPSVGLLSQRIRLPRMISDELATSLNRSLGVYRTQATLPTLATFPTLGGLARHRTATINEVVRAAQEAAALIEQEGEREKARELRTVSAEVVAVAEAPSVEKLEEMVSDLSELMEERLDEIQEQQGTNEERRQSDRRDDLNLNLLLWFLAIYLAWFLWMLDQLPRK